MASPESQDGRSMKPVGVGLKPAGASGTSGRQEWRAHRRGEEGRWWERAISVRQETRAMATVQCRKGSGSILSIQEEQQEVGYHG